MFANNFVIQLCDVINSDDHPYSFKSNFHVPCIFLLYYIMGSSLSSMRI